MTDIGIALQGTAKRRRREAMVRGWMFACAAFSIVVTAAIVLSLVGEAWTFISQVELNTLWGSRWAPRFGEHDLRTLFVGSAMVTGIAMLIAAPAGLGAAIYLSEYAPPRVRKTLKPVLEVLAGIPSVVLGFFALAVDLTQRRAAVQRRRAVQSRRRRHRCRSADHPAGGVDLRGRTAVGTQRAA